MLSIDDAELERPAGVSRGPFVGITGRSGLVCLLLRRGARGLGSLGCTGQLTVGLWMGPRRVNDCLAVVEGVIITNQGTRPLELPGPGGGGRGGLVRLMATPGGLGLGLGESRVAALEDTVPLFGERVAL